MKTTLNALSLAFLIGLIAPHANACANGQCSSALWTTSGSCAEFTANGETYVHDMPNKFCESHCGELQYK